MRGVTDTFKQVFEDEGVSPATASRVSQQIYQDFDEWRKRSLTGVDLLYLLVDGIRLKFAPERDQKQPVLLAYGVLRDGRKVLLHVDVGDRESYEACLGFLRDMTERRLRPPFRLPPSLVAFSALQRRLPGPAPGPEGGLAEEPAAEVPGAQDAEHSGQAAAWRAR